MKEMGNWSEVHSLRNDFLKNPYFKEDDGRVTYKLDIGANRYDLLCLEGVVRNLNIFQGK